MQMDPGSRSREIVVSCPYWIVNKTNLVLALRDTALNASPNPILAPAGLGGTAEPVLFRQASFHYQPSHTTYLFPWIR